MKAWGKISEEKANLERVLSVRKPREWDLQRAALPNHAQLLWFFCKVSLPPWARTSLDMQGSNAGELKTASLSIDQICSQQLFSLSA